MGFHSIKIVAILNIATILYVPTEAKPTEINISSDYPKDSLLNFTQLTNKYGYTSQEHTVVTEDGYILTVFRVNQGRKCTGQKNSVPVILMHGLLLNSDSWLDAGPNAGLAYLIADACFDLWVGNCRGNYYSRRHVSLDSNKDHEFWHFSADEMGYYDVPATIDYVLNYTKAKKVNYIGFSQGAGTFFIMCSERPGYCEKVNKLIALAPATRQTNTKSILYRFVAESIYKTEKFLTKIGFHELLPKGGFIQSFAAFFCPLNFLTVYICNIALAVIDAPHPGSLSSQTTKTLFGHFPAGTSVHNMARYGQSMMRSNFTKFDYGKDMNIKIYGNEVAPKYNLSAVSVPVVTLYGRNDGLVSVKDVEWLMNLLPNVAEVFEVKEPMWSHLDFTYSQYTSEQIFPKIHEHLKRT